MITGTVNTGREAQVVVAIRTSKETTREVRFVIDTGFTEYMTLPPEMISWLGLPKIGSRVLELADGSEAAFAVHVGTLSWHGQDRKVEVLSADGGALIGMGLLYGSRVSMDVIDGGAVEIDPL